MTAPGRHLRMTDLRAGYGALEILRGVSLDVPPGAIAGVIGPNGAGKSTLLKVLFGYLRPFAGAITFGEVNLVGLRPERIIRAGIGYVAQARGLFPAMTVRENLLLGGYVLKDRRAVAAGVERALTLFPQLRDRLAQVAGTMSGGQQRSLAIARALMVQPDLLLLDEPSAALDPQAIDTVYAMLREVNAAGVAMLIVEQNVQAVLDIAARVFVLDVGRNAFDGSSAELRGLDRIRQLYLGEDVAPAHA
jgi:ABC-type branched-subunit amino acid transport system ATPase component